MLVSSGRERGDRGLEPHLVVALAGAAVRDAVGAELLRDAGEVARDHRAAQRRHQRVALLVQRVGLERRHQEVVRELVLRVDDDRLDGAAVERALADVLHVFTALADVDGEGDDLFAGRILQPADADRGVESARVGEDDAFCHGVILLVIVVESTGEGQGACRAPATMARMSEPTSRPPVPSRRAPAPPAPPAPPVPPVPQYGEYAPAGYVAPAIRLRPVRHAAPPLHQPVRRRVVPGVSPGRAPAQDLGSGADHRSCSSSASSACSSALGYAAIFSDPVLLDEGFAAAGLGGFNGTVGARPR